MRRASTSGLVSIMNSAVSPAPIAGRLADTYGLEVALYIQGALAIGAGLAALFMIETNPLVLARRKPAVAAA